MVQVVIQELMEGPVEPEDSVVAVGVAVAVLEEVWVEPAVLEEAVGEAETM